MTALTQDVVADLRRRVDELEQRLQSSLDERDEAIAQQAATAVENARLFNETREALERQTATADILKVIASSPSDVQPVFEAIAESARRLSGGHSAAVTRVIGDMNHLAAFTAGSEAGTKELHSSFPSPLSGPGINNRVARTGELAFRTDIETEPDVPQAVKELARARGYRSILVVPMLRDGVSIGTIGVTRREPGPFSDHLVGLLRTFADQAVIAIENTRLFNETREALERQTATADILKVIASSPSDVQPVFEAIAERSNRLVEGLSTAVYSIVDDTQHLMAFTRKDPEADATLQALFPRPLSAVAWGKQIRNGEIFHVSDTEVELSAQPSLLEMARKRGFRSFLLVPLLRDRTPIGLISVTRAQPGRFAAHHIQLLQTFADQAVIAIENARLFNETKEALERQTATADILKVIASSPSDVQPVFEAIATSANRLIGGHSTAVCRFVEGAVHLAAFTPTSPAADEVLKASLPRPLADFPPFEWVREGKTGQIADAETIPDLRDLARARGYRSVLFAPLMSNGVPIGQIGVTRTEPGSFAAHHVQLLQTFADQAVIAIENTRLFNETKEALERQTATADILKVIASSPSDVQPVFEAIATSANRLLGGFSTAVLRFVDGVSHLAAFTPTTPAADEILKASFPRRIEFGQAGETVQITDTETSTGAQIRDVARARFP
jgi:GAF domain-containing protein